VPLRSIEDPASLRRILETVLLIEGNVDLPTLLRHVIEEARSMTGARYGALGVLNESRTGLAEFLTSGLEADDEKLIGERPTGLGVLGVLISDPQTLRISQLDVYPERFGFPPNHPAMTSFLGVSIKARGEVYGNLYLTDKEGGTEFNRDDEALVEALAIAGGIAIENARLHERAQTAVVLEDRDRLARDLHDTVIQRLFAVGLSLQSMASTAEAAGMGERLVAAVSDIDETIHRIRTTIYELGAPDTKRGVRSQMLSLARELQPVTGFQAEVSFSGPVDSAISDAIAEHLLAFAREALINVGKHANATSASLSVSFENGICRLQLSDNGKSLRHEDQQEDDTSLMNMRRRAEKLQGDVKIERSPTGGTKLTLAVPTDF
jgi:signal transduction histidine kinase